MKRFEPLNLNHAETLASCARAGIFGEAGLDDDEIFSEFFEDLLEGLTRPRRRTLLHDLIASTSKTFICELVYDWPHESAEDYDTFIRDAGQDLPSVPDKAADDKTYQAFREDLSRSVSNSIDYYIDSAFFILFSDRKLMFQFQRRLSNLVRNLKKTDHPILMKADGVLKRPSKLPEWLRRGVFFRDRGRCQSCLRDLTGTLGSNEGLALDHMVPLAASGSNDPTNFQILCTICNLQKSAKTIQFPQQYLPYW